MPLFPKDTLLKTAVGIIDLTTKSFPSLRSTKTEDQTTPKATKHYPGYITVNSTSETHSSLGEVMHLPAEMLKAYLAKLIVILSEAANNQGTENNLSIMKDLKSSQTGWYGIVGAMGTDSLALINKVDKKIIHRSLHLYLNNNQISLSTDGMSARDHCVEKIFPLKKLKVKISDLSAEHVGNLLLTKIDGKMCYNLILSVDAENKSATLSPLNRNSEWTKVRLGGSKRITIIESPKNFRECFRKM